jgi:hypothetical protein
MSGSVSNARLCAVMLMKKDKGRCGIRCGGESLLDPAGTDPASENMVQIGRVVSLEVLSAHSPVGGQFHPMLAAA